MKYRRHYTHFPKTSKLFVGCLPSLTSSEELEEYFARLIRVKKVKIKYRKNGICCGFGYIFVQGSSSEISLLCSQELTFSGRKIEVRPFYSKNKYIGFKLSQQSKKVFVANLPSSTTGKTLNRLFSKFGPIQNAYLGNFDEIELQNSLEETARDIGFDHKKYKENGSQFQRFGFIIFQEEYSLIEALRSQVTYQGHLLIVKRPRGTEGSEKLPLPESPAICDEKQFKAGSDLDFSSKDSLTILQKVVKNGPSFRYATNFRMNK